MRNADYESWSLSQRSLNRRLDNIAEDVEMLSILIRMFIANPAGTKQRLLDAAKPMSKGAVSADYQNQWLTNIQHDKLLELIAQMQHHERNIASKKITQQDKVKAFIIAHHKL
jgi:hypothetical protein